MRSTVFAVLAGALAAPAFSAGLDEPIVEPVVAAAPTSAASFDGAYVGGSLGLGSLDAEDAEDGLEDIFGGVADPEGFVSDTFDLTDGGFAHGLHAGYNVRRGSVVFGPEVAVFGAEIEVGGVSEFEDGQPEETIDADVGYGARVALRGGVARGATLVYGTLGLAYLDLSIDTDGVFLARTSESRDEFGYAAGLGVERKLTDRVSVGAQYSLHAFDDFEVGDDLEIDLAYRALDLRLSLGF